MGVCMILRGRYGHNVRLRFSGALVYDGRAVSALAACIDGVQDGKHIQVRVEEWDEATGYCLDAPERSPAGGMRRTHLNTAAQINAWRV